MGRRTDPPAGGLDGLVAFFEQMVEEGHVTRVTANHNKTAARKVAAAGEAAGLPPIDYFGDIEPYAEVFQSDKDNRYTPRSLANYVSRFRSAAVMYREFLDDPSWRPERRGPSVVEDPPGAGTVVTYEAAPGVSVRAQLPPEMTLDDLAATVATLQGQA